MNSEKDIFIRLTDKAKTVGLTEREKTALFSTVDSYVRKNPIQAQAKIPAKNPFAVPIRSPFADTMSTWTQSWHIHSFRAMAGAFVLVIIIGLGGTSLAAQGSLPGDTLYPIMVNINEGIKSAFLSGTAQIEYEVVRAKNRVSEAKQLVAENRLSPEIKEEIAVRLNTHVSKVQEDVKDLAKNGDLKTAYVISTELENELEASAGPIIAAATTDDISRTQDSASVSVSAISAGISSADSFETGLEDIVRAPLEAASESRKETENRILADSTNSEDVHIIAQSKLDETKKLMALLDQRGVGGLGGFAAPAAMMKMTVPVDDLSTSTASSATSSISSKNTSISTSTPPQTPEYAKELLRLGEEKFAAELYNEAFMLFKQAYEIVEFLEKETRPIEIDIIKSVDVQSEPDSNADSIKVNTNEVEILSTEVLDTPKNNNKNVAQPLKSFPR